jgi:hypothetical protein
MCGPALRGFRANRLGEDCDDQCELDWRGFDGGDGHPYRILAGFTWETGPNCSSDNRSHRKLLRPLLPHLWIPQPGRRIIRQHAGARPKCDAGSGSVVAERPSQWPYGLSVDAAKRYDSTRVLQRVRRRWLGRRVVSVQRTNRFSDSNYDAACGNELSFREHLTHDQLDRRGMTGAGTPPSLGSGPNFEIVVEVTPSNIPSFSASGLSLGGQHTWKYSYRFENVTLH